MGIRHHRHLRSRLRSPAAGVLRILEAEVRRILAARVIRNLAAAGSSRLEEAFLDDEADSRSARVDKIARESKKRQPPRSLTLLSVPSSATASIRRLRAVALRYPRIVFTVRRRLLSSCR